MRAFPVVLFAACLLAAEVGASRPRPAMVVFAQRGAVVEVGASGGPLRVVSRTPAIVLPAPDGQHFARLRLSSDAPGWSFLDPGRLLGPVEVLAADGRLLHRFRDALGPTWSADGRFLAVTGRDEGMVYDLRRGTVWRTPGNGDFVWSADARHLYSLVGSTLRVFDADTRHVLTAKPVWAAAWSPDGRQLAYTTRAGLMLAGPQLQRPRLLDRRPNASRLSWSPDGHRIAYTTTFFEVDYIWHSGLFVVDITSGESYAMYGTAEREQVDVDGLVWSPDSSTLVASEWYDDWLASFDAATGRVNWRETNPADDQPATVWVGDRILLLSKSWLTAVDAATGKLIARYGHASFALTPDHAQLAFTACRPAGNCELYLSTTANWQTRKLTHNGGIKGYVSWWPAGTDGDSPTLAQPTDLFARSTS